MAGLGKRPRISAARSPKLGLERPDFDDRVPPARDHVPVHIAEPFYWSCVSVSHERGVLHARAVVYLGKKEGER